MESAFPRNISASAHDWGQVLMFQGQSCSHFTSFTSWVSKPAKIPLNPCKH